MKALVGFATLMVCSGAVLAAPFVISDPVAVGVTHCGRYEAGTFKADVPIVAGGCKFDIGTQPSGTVVYTATAVVNDPLWGRQESVQSLPLSVVRSGVPPTPAALRASP
jgi:hypothetical protein